MTGAITPHEAAAWPLSADSTSSTVTPSKWRGWYEILLFFLLPNRVEEWINRAE